VQDKAEIRRQLLSRRDHIPPEVRKAKNRIIRESLLSLAAFRNAGIIFLYASFRTEVDTAELIKASLSGGKRVVLPKVDRERGELLLVEISDFSDLVPGYLGIPEPRVPGKQMDINDIALVILPGAGYDAAGNRIGYGGGYYDRLLSRLQMPVPLIAPAYEEQIIDAIPSEPHDIRVQMIVTDRRLIKCGDYPIS
jgi:5-formyltetrahydrofolate cyclo-ligase